MNARGTYIVPAIASLICLLTLGAIASAEEGPSSCITVKAMGCYLKLPSEVLLITDSPEEGTLLSLGAKGEFHLQSYSADRYKRLTEKSRVRRGHLAIIEYYQPAEREPVSLTVVTDGHQELEFSRDARHYVELVVESCVANTRPIMRVFRTLSQCDFRDEPKSAEEPH